jgi:DNA polymerase-3 subunit delta
MQIRPEQLEQHLKRELAPIYFVYGDEPLLVQESCDVIRAQARAAGCTEREVYSVESGFDWQGFLQAGDSLSLFADRKLVELRMPTGKPGDAGAKALAAYAARPAPDNVLLIMAGKLETAARKSKWHQALENAGVVVPIWPLEIKQLPAWVNRRMQARGLKPTTEAVTLLVERVEGNLLACAQEIEKLALVHGVGPIDVEQVTNSVANSSRFDAFTLVDAALEGDAVRVTRILDSLRLEGVEPILVLWAITRELRLMADCAQVMQRGQSVDGALAASKVWDKRKPLMRSGLQRHKPLVWRRLLQRAAGIDQLVKGGRAGNVWDELLQLVLIVAGVRLPLAV